MNQCLNTQLPEPPPLALLGDLDLKLWRHFFFRPRGRKILAALPDQETGRRPEPGPVAKLALLQLSGLVRRRHRHVQQAHLPAHLRRRVRLLLHGEAKREGQGHLELFPSKRISVWLV